ncbi:MAG: DUF547 domain-containing protein [Hormoscilla sp. GUM202]|nr:DUF547 domain-containing protein [Hormoscilla sp. GM7CHS1pb]MBO1346839.1 DUF547 domain-containing protein [Hormoscilla sp. GUM202]
MSFWMRSWQRNRWRSPLITSAAEFTYGDYAAVLKTYVNENARVDYKNLQANRQQLDAFNASLANVDRSTYAAWSKQQQIAFWINAYNAFTLQSIIDQNQIKKSIRDIPGVWRGREFAIAGELKTLDNIEHQILRSQFKEPRIHVALVCAAVSCPPLRREPDRLDAQLDDQTRKFLASSHGLRISRAEGRVDLSSIFKWFGKDWIETYGVEGKFTGGKSERAVLNFISQYLDEVDRDYLVQGNYKLKYLRYDWSLNKQ